jgi:hypothetical protein
MLLGAIKEIRGFRDLSLNINLNVKRGELTNFPSLKIRFMFFLSTLFLLGSIFKRKVLRAPFFFSLKVLFVQFYF